MKQFSDSDILTRPMRVAILTTDDREHFKDYGCPAPYFGTAPATLLGGLEQLPEAEVHVVACLRQRVTSPAKIAPNIWYHSLRVPKIGWLRTGYLGCIRATRRKLHAIQPDIVHGQGTERDCAVAAVFSGFPNVLTIHGNMIAIAAVLQARFGSFHWFAARLETLALRKTGGVFCNSAYTESLVAPRTKRTWRVPNPIRPAFLTPPPATSRPEPPIILNVGIIQPRKRQIELLAMARRLWERGPRFQLHFIGGINPANAYDADFARQLAAVETAGYARYRGVLQLTDLVAAFDGASALIHFPSEEAFGLVVAEALARNLKFFGASLGGIVEIASKAEGAELLAENDWPGLENAIAAWLKAGSPRPAAADQLMRRRYEPKIIAQRHLEIYREVLSTRS